MYEAAVRHQRSSLTGLKAEAFGFGLNEVALTLSLKDAEVAEVGEGGSSAVDTFSAPADPSTPLWEFPFNEVEVADPEAPPDSDRLPLNGGIF
jgi:hypothetical protein